MEISSASRTAPQHKYWCNPPFFPVHLARQLLHRIAEVATHKKLDVTLLVPVWLFNPRLFKIIMRIEKGERVFKNRSEDPRTKWLVLIVEPLVPAVHTIDGDVTFCAQQGARKKMSITKERLREVVKKIHLEMHCSTDLTMSLIKDYFEVQGCNVSEIRAVVEPIVKSCPRCQLSTRSRKGAVYKAIRASQPFEYLCMDWVSMPAAGKFDRFLAVTEKFSCYRILIPCSTKDTTEDLMNVVFFHEDCACVGKSELLVSKSECGAKNLMLIDLQDQRFRLLSVKKPV